MIKSAWTIDAKNRMAYFGLGVTVGFLRVDGEWTAKLQSRVDDHSGLQQIDQKALEDEALGLWQEEIDTAIGYLTFAGTSLYGENWIEPLAQDMHVESTKIHDWINQNVPLTMADSYWPMVLGAMVGREEKIIAAIVKVRSAFVDAREKSGICQDRSRLSSKSTLGLLRVNPWLMTGD